MFVSRVATVRLDVWKARLGRGEEIYNGTIPV